VVAPSAPIGRDQGRAHPRRSAWSARLESPLAAYYLVLGSVTALVAIGLVMVLSSSNIEALRESNNSYAVFSKQAVFAAIGLPLAWVASRLPIAVWKRLAWPALFVGAIGLVTVAVAGSTRNGNRNWLIIGPVTLQPSEAAKFALIIWSASVLSRKHALLGRVSHVLVPVVPGAVLLLGLVMLGNDLGTALILVGITAALLFTAGAPLRVFLVGGLLGAGVITLLVITSPNRMSRIGVWTNGACSRITQAQNLPDLYWSTCWQPLHGRWGLATGGWWGVGLGAGREKWLWLPEAHNDYIFAVIGEELGLAGTLVVLALFAALGVGLFRLVIASDDTFVKIATGGVLAWVLGQAIVNIGAVLGLLPVIGVPLPLVSSGGSALVTMMVALGMVLGFARRVPGAPEALAARPRPANRTAAVLPRGMARMGRITADHRRGRRR